MSGIRLVALLSLGFVLILSGTAGMCATYKNSVHGFSFDYDENVFKAQKPSSLFVMLVPKNADLEKNDKDPLLTFCTVKTSKFLTNYLPQRELKKKYDKILSMLWDKYSKEYKGAKKLKFGVDKFNGYPAAIAKFKYVNPDERELYVHIVKVFLYDMSYEIIFSTPAVTDNPKNSKAEEGKEKPTVVTADEFGTYAKAFDQLLVSFKIPALASPEGEKAYEAGLQALIDEKFDEARSNFVKASSLESGSVDPIYYIAVTLSRQEKREEAIKNLEVLLKMKPDFDYAWGYKAFNLLKLGKKADAWKCYEQGIENNPNSEILFLDRALLKLGEKNVSSKDVFEDINLSMKINPFYPKALYEFGVLSALAKNGSMAAYCLSKAAALEPENPDYWFMLGRVLGSRPDKAADAVTCFDKAIKLDGKNSRYFVEKAKACISLKDGNGALECLNQAIKVNRKDTTAWFYKGRLLLEAEKYKEALTTFNRILDMDPKSKEAWGFKASAYQRSGNDAEAENSIAKALEIDPDYVDALLIKASLYSKTSRKREAIEVFNKILELQPENQSAKNLRADIIREMSLN